MTKPKEREYLKDLATDDRTTLKLKFEIVR
jgi:hypothetical protein